ncbi:MAG: AraC family transcriptional regulator [Rikenellaceae bacterium]
MKLIERSSANFVGLVAKLRSRERIAYEQHSQCRFQLGYIINGEKHFTSQDRRIICKRGEIFFTPIGQIYSENIATERSGIFEQITFSFSPTELSAVLSTMVIDAPHGDKETSLQTPAIFTPSIITHGVIESINIRYDQGGFINTPLSERINLANLIVSIFENDAEHLKQIIAASLDIDQVNFKRIIYDNIFVDRSLNDLAVESNRSLTTFKKDFRRHFGNSPHSWFLQQRLNHAQNLLAITNDTIAHIGAVCTFPNTSHFIKLYKSHFGITPAQHRLKLRSGHPIKSS